MTDDKKASLALGRSVVELKQALLYMRPGSPEHAWCTATVRSLEGVIDRLLDRDSVGPLDGS